MLDVLRRHGFGGVLVGRTEWPEPERVVGALEELGVVYVNFGQVLSTRSDLLPERYVTALASLQDRVATLPTETVQRVIRQELGDDPDRLFASFREEPLASASVAQVHVASLRSGRPVVVKVQRPDLDVQVAEDVLVLSHLAAFLDLAIPRLRPYDLPSLVRDFQRTLEAELDFLQEARNIRRFRERLEGDRRVWIPAVVDEFTTTRVLTMERSNGERLEAYAQRHPEAAKALARRLGGLFVRQVFRDGFFHADPHPGNIFVLPDGALCLHDFGMVGELPRSMREALVDLVESTVSGDPRAATESYFDLGLVPRDVDRRAVEEGVSELVREVRSQPLSEVSVGRAVETVGRLGGRCRIRDPGVFLLLCRAFVTLEGVLAKLDPGVSFVEMFRPAFADSLSERLSVDRLGSDMAPTLRAMERLATDAPREARRILHRWGEGALGRVTVTPDPVEAARRTRSERSIRQTVAAGFLALAGAVLLAGAPERLATVGSIFLIGGAAALAYRFVRG